MSVKNGHDAKNQKKRERRKKLLTEESFERNVKMKKKKKSHIDKFSTKKQLLAAKNKH